MDLAELRPAAVFSPGIHHGLPFAEYLAIDALSASGMKRLLQSPAHFQADRVLPRKTTPAKQFGVAAHLAVLEPDRFPLEVSLAPNFNRRTTEGKAAAAEWESRNAGRMTFDLDTLAAIKGAAFAVRDHPAAGLLFSHGRPEVTLQWVDGTTGAACKARLDFLRDDGVLVDLKTIDDASPTGAARAIGRFRYHVQAAHYLSGIEHVLKYTPRAFVFVFVERTPPHGVACYVLPPDALAVGAGLCKQCMHLYVQCCLAQDWPSYSDLIQTIELPRWAM